MSVGLAMIVKNEAQNIPRLASSLRGKIDHYTILDSGSTDGTKSAIAEGFEGVSGKVIDTEWEWFGVTRTKAMDAAREAGTDWILMMDADEEFVGEYDFEIPPPCNAIGSQVFHGGGVTSWKPRLTRGSDRWTWKGRTHEDLIPPPGMKAVIFPTQTFHIVHHYDLRESPAKIERDLGLLALDLSDDPYDTRAIYYTAKTLQMKGALEAALKWYRIRASFRGDDNEYRDTLTQIGACMMALDGK
jgi:glycosyltransferase involved in cell wall biosynthesis